MFCASLSHLQCVLIDPGSVATGKASSRTSDLLRFETKGIPSLCEECQCYKTVHVHHCRRCGKCFEKMDHHCPWINNCVARDNCKFFLQFLFYVFWLCVFFLFVLCLALFYSTKNSQPVSSPFFNLLIFGGYLALGFGAGTAFMFTSLLLRLCANTTLIDALQSKSYTKRSLNLTLKEVCGGSLSLYWFIPSAPNKSEPSFIDL